MLSRRIASLAGLLVLGACAASVPPPVTVEGPIVPDPVTLQQQRRHSNPQDRHRLEQGLDAVGAEVKRLRDQLEQRDQP